MVDIRFLMNPPPQAPARQATLNINTMPSPQTSSPSPIPTIQLTAWDEWEGEASRIVPVTIQKYNMGDRVGLVLRLIVPVLVPGQPDPEAGDKVPLVKAQGPVEDEHEREAAACQYIIDHLDDETCSFHNPERLRPQDWVVKRIFGRVDGRPPCIKRRGLAWCEGLELVSPEMEWTGQNGELTIKRLSLLVENIRKWCRHVTFFQGTVPDGHHARVRKAMEYGKASTRGLGSMSDMERSSNMVMIELGRVGLDGASGQELESGRPSSSMTAERSYEVLHPKRRRMRSPADNQPGGRTADWCQQFD